MGSYREARVLLADGRPAEAENVLLAAIRNAEHFGEKSLLWRLHGCLGQAFKDQAKRKESIAALKKGKEIVAEIAASISEEELRAEFFMRANRILVNEGRE